MTEDDDGGASALETEHDVSPSGGDAATGPAGLELASPSEEPPSDVLPADEEPRSGEGADVLCVREEDSARTGPLAGLELASPGAARSGVSPADDEPPSNEGGEAAVAAPSEPAPALRSAGAPVAEPPRSLGARVPHARARTAAGFLVGVIALALVVVVQHLRHGWPFSIHHGMSSQVATTPRPPSVPTATTTPRAHVELPQERWSTLGVRVEPARREAMGGTLRAVVTIVPDESRVSHVHTRVSGWIDRLYVRTTGEPVRAGQALCAIFSQELLASQTEYLAARRAMPAGESSIARGARERLGVLGMTEAQIRALERRGQAERLVTVVAPRAGVVLHRGVTEGTAIDPSTELFTIGDLSSVWALTEVPEVDAARVGVGSRAALDVPGSGTAPVEASVAFVYPTLSERTRTLRARFVVPNTQARLLPGMYGTATFETQARESIVVPRDALVDTGIEQHVFVLEGESMFVPRPVRVGLSLDDRVEILEGLREGEAVAASGVFLLDSESRLRASGQAGTGHAHGGGTREAPAPAAPAGHAGHGATP